MDARAESQGSRVNETIGTIVGPGPLPGVLPTIPPALLHERLITDAHEVLVLTYSADLQFFEATCLADALASTGRVTVVYDADKGLAAPDETPARGIRYLDVPVRCRSGGEFHPKLVVVASPERAVVAIGSGNATSAGWHYNAELWTVLAGEAGSYPAAFERLADWLHAIPGRLLIDSFGAERVRDVAELLRRQPANGGGPKLVHNLNAPLLTQLDSGPSSKLTVASPFLDKKAAALRAVLDRLTPTNSTVALTRAASFDAPALTDALARVGGQAAAIASGKYFHGKLVQYDLANGRRRALVGSANCTAAALLLTMAESHGNCELGLIVDVPEPVDLIPRCGDPLDAAEIAAHAAAGPPPPDERPPEQPVLARVLRSLHGLTLTVFGLRGAGLAGARLVSDGAEIPVYPGPDTGLVLTGTCSETALAGALVTVILADGTSVGPAAVTDPDAVLTRLEKPSPLERHSLARTLTDPGLTEELLDALERLAAIRPRNAAVVPEETGGGRSVQAWLDRWATTAAEAVGQTLVSLALGNDPGARASAFVSAAADEEDPGEIDHATDEEVDEALISVGDHGENETGSGPSGDSLPSLAAQLSKRQRRRIIRLLDRRAAQATAWTLPAQIALLGVLTVAVGAGLYRDDPWTPAIVDLVSAMVPDGVNGPVEPDHDNFEPHRLALGAVCLALTARAVSDWSGRGRPMTDFEAIRARLGGEPDAIDRGLLAGYAAGLDRVLGPTMSAEAIWDALGFLLTDERLTRIVESLLQSGIAVEFHSARVLVAQGKGDPRGLAYRIATRAESEAPVAVVARAELQTVAIAWVPPDVVEVTQVPTGTRGRLMRPVLGIGSLAGGGTPRPLRQWRGTLPQELKQTLAAAGLNHPTLV